MHSPETYKEARLKPAVVYWIHYPEQSDPFCDGYIGISTNLPERVSNHKRRNKHMFNRLMKGAVIEVLHECETLDKAAEKEKEYRPHSNIGWNLNAGGDSPPSQVGRTYSAQKLKGDQRTDRQKKASAKRSERMKGATPHNKGKCSKIEIDGVVFQSAYEARDALGISLSKVYRIGVKIDT